MSRAAAVVLLAVGLVVFGCGVQTAASSAPSTVETITSQQWAPVVQELTR